MDNAQITKSIDGAPDQGRVMGPSKMANQRTWAESYPYDLPPFGERSMNRRIPRMDSHLAKSILRGLSSEKEMAARDLLLCDIHEMLEERNG